MNKYIVKLIFNKHIQTILYKNKVVPKSFTFVRSKKSICSVWKLLFWSNGDRKLDKKITL